MSGLYKRGKIWWLRTDPVTGNRLSTRCTNAKAAQAFLAERERLGADPNYAASHSATVGLWAKELIRVKQASKAAGTSRMYNVKIGHVVRVFGEDCRMVDVNPANVDRFVAQRQAEGAVNNTIGKELTAIAQLCKLAKRGGAYAGDISALRPIGFSTGYKPRKRVLTLAEAECILAALEPRKRAALCLALATGARHSELARITRGHVDLDGWIVHIPGTKTEDSDRTIPIVNDQHRKYLAAALDHLPVRWPRMSKDLPELCERLGLEPVTANDIRRTFATWNIEAGVSREDTAKLMGHGSTAMVFKVYGRESAEAFGKKLRGEAGTRESQSSPVGSVCSLPDSAKSLMVSLVAPERFELSCPEGRRILNPRRCVPTRGDVAETSGESRSDVSPDTAEYRSVRTPASQPEPLDHLLLTAAFHHVAARVERAARVLGGGR